MHLLSIHYLYCCLYLAVYYCAFPHRTAIFSELLLFAALGLAWDALAVVSLVIHHRVSPLPEVEVETRATEEAQAVYRRIAHLSEKTLQRDTVESAICAICLEKLEAGMRLSCGHQFHTECITNSFSVSSARCPMCREESVLGVLLHNMSQGVL
jgi:hypothetical protein